MKIRGSWFLLKMEKFWNILTRPGSPPDSVWLAIVTSFDHTYKIKNLQKKLRLKVHVLFTSNCQRVRPSTPIE